MDDFILAGPFIGELWWEIFHFAGHVIYTKTKNPQYKLVVLTRQNRFDLYGRYADFLIPLKLKDENKYRQECFRLTDMSEQYYRGIVEAFRRKYKNENIKFHIYPDIHEYFFNLKWQFPRSKFIYDFRPRMTNRDITARVVHLHRKNLIATDIHDLFENSDYELININNFLYELKRYPDNRVSELGCIIELLKRCNFFISNTKSIVAKLALIMGIPVISYNDKMDEADSKIISKTPIFSCTNIQEGILKYEDYIRSKKDRPRQQRRKFNAN